MPNKYGEAALIAVNKKDVTSPQLRWMMATEMVFPESPSSQVKGCPKGAFLGLCEEGLIKGIGHGSYTTSKDNKSYALKAVEILRAGKSFTTPGALWNEVMNGANKVHNSQMDVVIALWEHDYIEH